MSRSIKHSQGFTIIEVLIVLAIGGLIMLLIFQAIPALQRGSRNNTRKSDISQILGAVSRYSLNNSGNFPTGWTEIDGASSGSVSSKLQIYEPSNVTFVAKAPGGGSPTAKVRNSENVYIFNYRRCDLADLGDDTVDGAGYRDVVALYALESDGSGATPQCKQL